MRIILFLHTGVYDGVLIKKLADLVQLILEYRDSIYSTSVRDGRVVLSFSTVESCSSFADTLREEMYCMFAFEA